MHINSLSRTGCIGLLLIASAAVTQAQTYETVGTRAQGMAGAFVAVADDASATWWNPAGMATGASLSSIVERAESDIPSVVPAAGPATRQTVTSVATTFPSLGLSVYHFHVNSVAPLPSTVSDPSGRQDEQAQVLSRSLSYTQFGVTVGQSIGNHLVIGSTVNVLHGGTSVATDTARGVASLDLANDLPVPSETHADLDVGAMAALGVVRLGVNVKHLAQPSFGTGDARVELAHQARAGIALLGHTPGVVGALTLAFDGDLTRTATASGDVRHVAVGLEAWLWSKRLGVRGGLSRNTVNAPRQTGSTGVSVALKQGVYVDGAWTVGSDTSQSGWVVALRMSY